ncbi:MAG: lytic murein transglycosylase B [Agarilytica sp.]
MKISIKLFKAPWAKLHSLLRSSGYFIRGVVGVSASVLALSATADYSVHPGAEAFIQKMVSEHKFTEKEVASLLSQANKQESILEAISRPAEKTKEWFEYRNIFIQESRIKQGVAFWNEHKATIQRASEEMGVAPEIIVAIIGVETRYGRHAGKYRVIDALSTLGFDYPKRGKFFRGQLEHYMLMTREQEQDPLSLKGSYAGAMGYGQFIPSSYRAYAVDFDDDNKVDIWNNPVDAIGSVANYFKAHKWKDGQPVLARARISGEYDKDILNEKSKPKYSLAELEKKGFRLASAENKDKEKFTPGSFSPDSKAMPLMYVGDHGKEFWLGFNNFYVITRYNRSHLYAMAVWELGEKIKQEMK